jgi:hypothetical protein
MMSLSFPKQSPFLLLPQSQRRENGIIQSRSWLFGKIRKKKMFPKLIVSQTERRRAKKRMKSPRKMVEEGFLHWGCMKVIKYI